MLCHNKTNSKIQRKVVGELTERETTLKDVLEKVENIDSRHDDSARKI